MPLLKSSILSLLTIGLSIQFSYAQHIQLQSLDLIVLHMADHNIYESATIGFAGQKSNQHKRFEQMTTLASEEQLLDLAAHHNNAVVRLYAFRALKQRKMAIPTLLANKFKNDQTIVTAFIGCVRFKKTIAYLADSGMGELNFASYDRPMQKSMIQIPFLGFQ